MRTGNESLVCLDLVVSVVVFFPCPMHMSTR